jgi:amino acid transporter
MGPAGSAPYTGLAAGVITPIHLVFTVLAALAPLTLMVAVAPLHFLKGGAAVPGAFLVAGVVMMVFALTLLQLRDSLPRGNSLREMIGAGLGEPIGAGAGLLALLAYNALQISVYGALGVYGSAALALQGVALAWWVIAWGGLLVVTGFGLRGMQASSRALALILLAEIGALCWLAVALMPGAASSGDLGRILDPDHFRVAVVPLFTLVFGAFMGFEATLIFARETRGGGLGIRRATLFSLGFITLFYAGLTTLVATTIGLDLISARAAQDTEFLVLSLFWQYTPCWLSGAMQWLLAGSAFAALLALHNIATRCFHALAEDRLLPVALTRTSQDQGVPWAATLLQSGVAAAALAAVLLAGIDPYFGLLLWGSALGLMIMVLLWALCACASVRFAWRGRGLRGLPLVLPAAACALLLSAVATVTMVDFAALTGAGPLVNGLLLGSAGAAFAAGMWRAWRRPALERQHAPAGEP